MQLEGTIHCDGPDCEGHAHVNTQAMEAGRLNVNFMRLTEYGDAKDTHHAFCSYDCLMKWCAKFPPTEIFPLDPVE